MAPLSLEVWASDLAAYPEALELLMQIPFPERSDDDLVQQNSCSESVLLTDNTEQNAKFAWKTTNKSIDATSS